MSAGIIQGIDIGLVGFVETLGETWHQFPEYKHVEGPVEIAAVREILEYPVIKVPVALHAPDHDWNGEIAPDAYMLCDERDGRCVYGGSVTGEYVIHQNVDFLNNLQTSILDALNDAGEHVYPGIAIESAGTLFALRVAFVNILIDQFHVKNDHSETVSRLMYYNAFGGRSLACGAHNTRIVCNNTLRMAEVQAEANKSIGKFKHTKNAATRMRDHLVDLSAVYAKVQEHREVLDHLAVTPMTSKDLDNFTRHLFPIPRGAKQCTRTGRVNNRDKIVQLFETLPDIQGDIGNTRYAALQAVTYYTGNEMNRGDSDKAFAYFNAVTGGNRDALNQTAFETLIKEDMEEVSDPELVAA